MKPKICAIHQPNFFPWLGYFDKIKKADVFIFLDAVDYPKSGSGMGSWCNRVKLAVQQKAHWVGCPIQRYSGIKKILEVKIQDQEPWRRKLLRTVELNYCHSPNYQTMMKIIEPLITYETDNLRDFNVHAIKTLAAYLEINCEFHLQSELNVTGRATELLINLTQAVNCDTYLCGGGASGYQEDVLFQTNGIQLQYQNFVDAPHGNVDSFIPGLSIIDFMMKVDKLCLNLNREPIC